MTNEQMARTLDGSQAIRFHEENGYLLIWAGASTIGVYQPEEMGWTQIGVLSLIASLLPVSENPTEQEISEAVYEELGRYEESEAITA